MNQGNESVVWQEITSQPQVWRAVWQRLQGLRDAVSGLLFSECWDSILFAGCGSTHYLSLAAANLYQQLTGQRTQGLPSSEIALFPSGVYPDIPPQRVLLIAVSRSGETSETLWAVHEHQRRRQPVLTITCRGNSPLATESQAVVAVDEADEQSVAQTRSFTSMYLAAQYVAGLAADGREFLAAVEQLPSQGQSLFDRYGALIAQLGGMSWDRIIVLGSGTNYGLACEGMLKLKEMALVASEAYHFLEYRHGPISLVDEKTLVVGLLSDTAAAIERDVLDDVRRLGGHTLAVGERLPGPEAASYIMSLETGLPYLARGVLYLVPLQMLAYHQARARGLDPDRPRHITQAVVLPAAAP